VSTTEKIHSLHGRPLWIDTGDREVDAMLTGHVRVVTGIGERTVYGVSC
jgi:predicted polyphosphate/ATP-dependent NAD kinase